MIARKLERVGLAITKSQEAVHLISHGLVQIADSARGSDCVSAGFG